MKFFQNLLAAALCVLSLSLSAQIEVDNTLTVEELINEVLLGQGVDAFNITVNGNPGDQVFIQAGTFNASSSDFPIDSGVVMATSLINIVNTGGGENNINIPEVPDSSDADLSVIAGFPSRNACIIEFDFTAASDSIRFNYIFSSAEYPNFTCSSYNDVFGFFLSGPGVSGDFEGNAKNIALIPETDIQVGVNSVNSGFPANDPDCLEVNPNYQDDSVYFVSNDPPEPGGLQIPGHTVVLTAEEAIECGGTYHIKLAISNAQDEFLQSAVFLEAGSFSAFGEIFASFSPVFGEGGAVVQEGYDSIAVAGCTNPIVELIRPTGSTFSSIEFELGGDAVQGQDYQLVDEFPSGFPDGVDTVFFEIETIDPTITDTLFIELLIIYESCAGENDTTIVEIPIAPPPEIFATAADVDIVCPTDSLVIESEAMGGLLPHIFNWEDIGFEEDGSSILVPLPSDEQQYVIEITDQCEFVYAYDTVTVSNSVPPPLSTSIDPFSDPTCPNEPVELTGGSANGNPPYVYTWTDSNGNNYPPESAPTTSVDLIDINTAVQAFTPQLEVFLTSIDSCGTQVTDSVFVNYPIYDSLAVSFGPLTDNCPSGPVELTAETEGGAGDLTYTWEIEEGESAFADGFGANTQTTFIVAEPGFNTFRLTVEDRCDRLGQSIVSFTGNDIDLSIGQDTSSFRLPYIKLDPLPNIITPNGDGQNEVFVVPGINDFTNASVLIYDRWGKLIYESDSYDAGTNDATVSQGFSADGFSDGTYFYVINIDSGECVTQGNLEVIGGSE